MAAQWLAERAVLSARASRHRAPARSCAPRRAGLAVINPSRLGSSRVGFVCEGGPSTAKRSDGATTPKTARPAPVFDNTKPHGESRSSATLDPVLRRRSGTAPTVSTAIAPSVSFVGVARRIARMDVASLRRSDDAAFRCRLATNAFPCGRRRLRRSHALDDGVCPVPGRAYVYRRRQHRRLLARKHSQANPRCSDWPPGFGRRFRRPPRPERSARIGQRRPPAQVTSVPWMRACTASVPAGTSEASDPSQTLTGSPAKAESSRLPVPRRCLAQPLRHMTWPRSRPLRSRS